MSIREPFHADIEQALGTVQLDTDLFERLAAVLVESKGTKFCASVRLGRAGKWRIRAAYSDTHIPWHATPYRLVTAR